jgi:hypothetical protein
LWCCGVCVSRFKKNDAAQTFTRFFGHPTASQSTRLARR